MSHQVTELRPPTESGAIMFVSGKASIRVAVLYWRHRPQSVSQYGALLKHATCSAVSSPRAL